MSGDAPPLDPRLTPARGDLAAATLRGRVEAERYVDGETFTVAAELVDLKRAPRPDAPLDTQLLHGETVSVFEDEDGWGWVQAERDGYVGYVAMQALVRGPAAATHRVVVRRTFVYPAADMKQPVLAALPMDGRVRVLSTSGLYARIADHGFVVAAHLSPLEAVAVDYVAVAESFLGTPYLWGGKSALGVDCSGLVQVSTSLAGLRLPRDTDLQARIGSAVPVDAALGGMRRGDLVFWKGHVGVMADATMLLHASGYQMLVTKEPIAVARARILDTGGNDIVAVRRLTIA